jgi:hypothetical protein
MGILSVDDSQKYKVEPDFDLVVRGLMIKRLKRLNSDATKPQLHQAKMEAIVDSLQAYGFLPLVRKPTEVQFAVQCLLTFRKEVGVDGSPAPETERDETNP